MSASLGRTRRSTSKYFPSPVSSSSSAITDKEMETKTNGKRKHNGKKSSSSSAKKNKQTAKIKVERTKSFEPKWSGNVINDDSEYPPVHTLILGTHPSIASLSKNEMYGHPLNAFWYLAGDALGFRRSAAVSPTTGKPYVYYFEHLRYDNEHILDYSQQLERVVSKGFAMWDIVAECEREGSLDQDIQEEVANPIREFCEGTLNNIERTSVKRIVIANGTTGAKFFVKHFTDWFVDGKLCAASDDMSQRAFKTVMNKQRRAIGETATNESNNGVIEVVCLPGVSPAAAKFTYLEKRAAWEAGCFLPGLKDSETWQSSIEQPKQQTTAYKTPEKQKQQIQTPKRERKTPASSPKEPAFRILSSSIAKLAQENEWIDLNVPPHELRPSATLTNGQCFNWMVVDTDELAETLHSPRQSAWGTHDAKEWIGPLGDRVLSIKETPTTTMFRVLYGPTEGTKEYLQQYFRLETPLLPLYKEWSKADARLKKIAAAIPGVRILRQEPLECIFSFICTSNNNIPRITKMLSSFRETYGSFMMEIPIQSSAGDPQSISIFSFPTLDSLEYATEEDLRAMGLGYRAKYIVGTRDLLQTSGGEEYLLNLRSNNDCQAVQDELTKFSGIGRKVADCVALFSLDSDESIPVDVHVQHIASRDYDPTVLGQAKSLTPTIYKRVGDLFRSRFPNRAGWAHSLLFVAELPSFRSVLPLDMVKEMDEWKKHEQEQKAKQKQKKEKKKDS